MVLRSGLGVLFLAPRPRDERALASKDEVRRIFFRIHEAALQHRIEIANEWGVQFEDLTGLLSAHDPHIVHFSGHGEEDGLRFEDDLGSGQFVPNSAFVGLLASGLAKQLRCVILNSCAGWGLARMLEPHVDFIIGTDAPIRDRAAVAFSEGFYTALSAGQPLGIAYRAGRAQFIAHAAASDAPELFVRAGADPATWPCW